MAAKDRGIFVALDTSELKKATDLALSLRDSIAGVKLGLEFFMSEGKEGVAAIVQLGIPVFLDLKFHDIPNTVAGAMAAIAPLEAAIVNLHALGGHEMMQKGAYALRERAQKSGFAIPKIIAVTVLTSMSDHDLISTGQEPPSLEQVRRLANLAKESGLDGVVCSPLEISDLRRDLGEDFLLVTPGVRPIFAAKGDQKRTMTPSEAIKAGADYLVIGRPITEAPDPKAAAAEINTELASALA